MNSFKVTTLSLVAAAAIALTGCGSDDTTVTTAWDINVTGEGDTSTCLDVATSTISGTCGVDTTLTLANSPYKLAGNKVKVVNGATLTIEAGVRVYGESLAYLVVTKGSKIEAVGTALNPIIFTSEIAELNASAAAAGQWGGITILGNASTNEAESIRYEVDSADEDFAYGGNGSYDTESSGTLQYVQILNSGYAVAPEKEVNGLSLCGIGSGTVVDNIKVKDSGDDGIEIWGGKVNLTNIQIEGAQDDGFDIDSGYQGSVTNLTVTQTEPGAALIEMTNGGDATKQRTTLTLDNFTLTASVNQKKEGGIYFKDMDVTGSFSNGTVDMTASPELNTGAGLTNKEGVYASPSFTNVTVKSSAFVTDYANKKDGNTTDAGTIELESAWTTGTGNTHTTF